MTKQAMQLDYVPRCAFVGCPRNCVTRVRCARRLTVKYTSADESGQIYIPAVNWLMFVVTAALVLGFGSSSSLVGAYGIAVCGNMLITSILACIVFGHNKGWGMPRAIALFVPHGFVEVCFFASNVLKIPSGGWFPLVLGFTIFALMTTWRRGNLVLEEDARARGLQESITDFTERIVGLGVVRVRGTVVVLAPTATEIPRVLLVHVDHNHALHERVVIVSVVTKDVPAVPDDLRVQVVPMRGGCFFVRVRFGFMDDPDVPAALALCAPLGLDISIAEAVFMVGREKVVPMRTEHSGHMLYARKVVFAGMKSVTSSASDYFNLPSGRVLELGTYTAL